MARQSVTGAEGNPFAQAPVMNPAQLGGIETSVLDNGPGRGVRIAWVKTGGGLRYKVVIDRGLDILDAEFLGQSLTWHSAGGIVAPSPAHHRGMEWLRGFFGGMLVSCGPLNTGAPFAEEGEEYGIHGTHSHTPATVEFITNPDPARGRYEMNITGIVRTDRMFGPHIELRRTISSTLGENSIRIYDQFTNRGNEPTPHAWLLHINFGYPLLEPEASTYCYRGKLTPRGQDTAWFTSGRDFRAAPQPQETHRGRGEVFTYVDAEPDADGDVVCGVVNRRRGFGVRIEYPAADFARLGNWQHWGPAGSYTGALEPMTGGVESRPVDWQRGWKNIIEPGQTIEHRCSITATNAAAELEALLALNH